MHFALRRGPAAFSFLELLISITLLVIGILFVVGLFLSMASRTDNDGVRLQMSHFVESYQAEIRSRTEAEWIALLTAPLVETKTWNGREVRVETEVARLSSDTTSPDFRVFAFKSVVFWQRKRIEGGEGGQESRLEFFSQATPTARY